MVRRCPGTGILDVGRMLFRPGPDLVEQTRQVLAKLGQLIFNSRRDDRKHFAPDKAVAFQHTQRLGQHFRRDAFQLARQLAITLPAAPQRANGQVDPFAGQHLEHGMRRAGTPERVVAEWGFVFTIHEVPIYRKGTY